MSGKELRLHSPVGGESLIYAWPLVKTKLYNQGKEIIDTIRALMDQYEELKIVVNKCLPHTIDKVDTENYETMKELTEKFSRAADTIKTLWKGATRPGTTLGMGAVGGGKTSDSAMLRKIIALAFNRAVEDPDILNHHYEAFSSQTYGETTFEQLQKIIEEIKPREKDIFVDLGSGVGQVVVHVAGAAKCRKVVGIEIADVPSAYSQTLKTEFERWMKWYGKKFKPFELIKGDFLSPELRNLVTQDATIIFINNYAFQPELEHRIKLELLAELKDGTRVISTKPYCHAKAEGVRLSDRRLGDLDAIMDVYQLTAVPQSTSWTNKTVHYYMHTVNRTKLERYFAEKNGSSSSSCSGDNGGAKVGVHGDVDIGSRRSSGSKSSSRESSASRSIRGGDERVSTHKHKRKDHLLQAVGGMQLSKKSASASSVVLPPSAGQETAFGAGSSGIKIPSSAGVPSSFGGGSGGFYGPTTRRQWSDWVHEQEKNKKHKQRAASTTGTSASATASTAGKPKVERLDSTDSAQSDEAILGANVMPVSHQQRSSSISAAGTVKKPSAVRRSSVRRSPDDDGEQDDDRSPIVTPMVTAAAVSPRHHHKQGWTILKAPGAVGATVPGITKTVLLKKKPRGRPRKSDDERRGRATASTSSSTQPMRRTTQRRLSGDALSSSGSSRRMSGDETSAAITRSTLDILHNLTVKSTAESHVESDDVHVRNLPKTSLIGPLTAVTDEDDGQQTTDELTLESTGAASKYPKLDQLFKKLKRQYVEQLDYMQTSGFRESVMEAIEGEKRKVHLTQRVERLERQVSKLQEEGVKFLKQRLAELNIVAETPAELLNQSKEIVLRHKELQSKANQLDEHVASLHQHNQQLVYLCRDRDEQTVKSGLLQALGFPERMTVETAKECILRDIGVHFSRQRALMNELARVETDVVAIQQNLPAGVVQLLEAGGAQQQSQQQATLPAETASIQAVDHHLYRHLQSPSDSHALSPRPLASTIPQQLPPKKMPSGRHRQPKSAVASRKGRAGTALGATGATVVGPGPILSATSIPATLAAGMKSTTSAVGGGVSTSSSTVVTSASSDPQHEEEIDRKVQDIVQTVFSCSAEKERKAAKSAAAAAAAAASDHHHRGGAAIRKQSAASMTAIRQPLTATSVASTVAAVAAGGAMTEMSQLTTDADAEQRAEIGSEKEDVYCPPMSMGQPVMVARGLVPVVMEPQLSPVIDTVATPSAVDVEQTKSEYEPLRKRQRSGSSEETASAHSDDGTMAREVAPLEEDTKSASEDSQGQQANVQKEPLTGGESVDDKCL